LLSDSFDSSTVASAVLLSLRDTEGLVNCNLLDTQGLPWREGKGAQVELTVCQSWSASPGDGDVTKGGGCKLCMYVQRASHQTMARFPSGLESTPSYSQASLRKTARPVGHKGGQHQGAAKVCYG
jgi:hypothetical protein